MKILIALLFSISAFAATPSQDYQHFDGLKVGDKTYPSGSSLVEIKSTTQGLLIPRMTTTQRNAIATPVDGLLVFDTTLQTVVEYNSNTSSWTFLVTSSGASLLNNNIAVITDSSGNLTSSPTTATQLGYLQYVTAAGGDIIYTSGTGMLGLAAGNANYLLQSNGSGAPSWVNSYSGNAATATTSTNSTNVLSTNTAANSTYYPLLAPSITTGQQSPIFSSGFSVNPSTDIVTATTFS